MESGARGEEAGTTTGLEEQGEGHAAQVEEEGAAVSEARTILALDLGQHTGWAADLGGSIVSDSISFKPSRYEGGGMPFLRFERWLTEIHALQPLRVIYFEEVRAHRGTAAAHWYGGFLAILTAWCERNEIPYQGAPVGTWKKHLTGKGNCDKAAVGAELRRRSFAPSSEDEADAIGVLLWARELTA